jgi:hypothetical protein
MSLFAKRAGVALLATLSALLGLWAFGHACGGCTPAQDATALADVQKLIVPTEAACQLAGDTGQPLVTLVCIGLEGTEQTVAAVLQAQTTTVVTPTIGSPQVTFAGADRTRALALVAKCSAAHDAGGGG